MQNVVMKAATQVNLAAYDPSLHCTPEAIVADYCMAGRDNLERGSLCRLIKCAYPKGILGKESFVSDIGLGRVLQSPNIVQQ